ncbi:hypothetical protein U8527_00870 [Kordia algicida OT-1]|uniref:Adhesin domain-containing protein n=1 Tax=Kordia algicida OT-1 TaxID=391587 RepID=A9DRV0_9FLAO|nr:hypothetical protein [Kordia algicida]EDP96846.1 hypothetical protein KAOT1_16823 [Kordia algicida OT-1]
MASSFYKTVLIGVVCLLSFQSTLAQHKRTKEIKETHAFSNESKLYLENKYGDIFVSGWEKNSIEIIVNIEAESKNAEKSEKLLNRVKTSIILTDTELKLTSTIAKKEGGFLGRLDPFKNEKTKINYTIYMPKKAMMEVYNTYGNIIISDWNGALKANIEHGKMQLSSAIQNADITIKFGKLNAINLEASTVKANDATLTIHNGNDLKITSDGSEMTLNNMKNLELNSNKDNTDILKVDGISGSIKHSKTFLKNLGGKTILDLYYGELRVLKHITTSPEININQKESEVYINISDINFTFKAKLEQGVLRIPKTMNNIESEIIDRKDKIRRISASYGAKNNGTITCTGYKGVILLKEL